jgi:glutamyl-Q tRNA(Asp) synthetase
VTRRVGRFAPSPTGRLHFGSILAAVASYIDARANKSTWLVRMEDIDTPRVVAGAADDILRTLEQFGFEWDGQVLFQSTRTEAYSAALQNLRDRGHVYGCRCSRKEVAEIRYPGRCREANLSASESRAWRVRVPHDVICFEDRVQGTYCQRLEEDVGDFVVLRADGLFAYQLAVVVDDAEQGITDVVRGADLLDSTPRQIWLQRLLGYSTPSYLHVPVIVNEAGQKLSKQTLAAPVDPANPIPTLRKALQLLDQSDPETGNICEFWRTAIATWNPRQIQRRSSVVIDD